MDLTTEQRIAMLLDELLRRGVPRELIDKIVDWLDEQRPPHLRTRSRKWPTSSSKP